MKAIVLLALVVLASATPVDHPMLKHFMDDDSRFARVVGGQETTSASEIPYQILLLFQQSFTCGGSILNEQWILTAAHCIDERPASALQVQVGTNLASGSGGRRYDVIFAQMHESYGSFTNDIALVKIAGNLEWSDTVQPIAIAAEAPTTGQQVILSGFGRTVNGGPVSEVLKWTFSNTLSRTNCVLGTGITHSGTICFFASSGTGVCNGDSGGPAVIERDGVRHQVGVANFVVGGCGAGNPDGYANAVYYKDWVESTIAANL